MALPAYSMTWPTAPAVPILRDDRQDHVLAGDARAQRAVDADAHRLGLALPQALRRHDMRHFRRADAEGERAQRAVRRGVGVAADQGEAGLGDALLRADDMGDALPLVAEVEQGDAALGRVGADLLDQLAMMRIDDVRHVAAVAPHIVVGRREAAVRTAQLHVALPQLGEARRRAVMHQVAVDVEQRVAVVAIDDDVTLPDLLEHRACGGHALPP